MNEKPHYSRFVDEPITLAGCGGVGSHCAGVLAKTGTPQMSIWDNKRVAPVNLQMQNFNASDMGREKVEVVYEQLKCMRPELNVLTYRRRLTASDDLDGVVVSGVDSMESRSSIWESVLRNRKYVPIYLDGRLSKAHPDFFQLFAINPMDVTACVEYEKWLTVEGRNEHEERPHALVAQTPILLAGIIGSVLARWSTGERYPWHSSFNGRSLHLETYFAT